MSISVIYDIDLVDENYDEDYKQFYVKAIVEDMALEYMGDYWNPPEYGPAVCEANFILEKEELLPHDPNNLIEFIEALELDWELVKDDYWFNKWKTKTLFPTANPKKINGIVV